MKNKSIRFGFLSFLLVFSFVLSASAADKQKAEEIVAKHLESIGTKEKRDAVKNRALVSDVQLNIKGTPGDISGKAVIFSSGVKNLWGINLNSNDYPQDRFSFNGKDVKVGYIRPGVRSVLGGFIFSYDELLKEGLLGGVLSSWALMDTGAKSPKLSYEGQKKIDGAEAHVISYMPKSGSDLDIKMYFDAKNYRHLRTEYTRVVAARQGSTIDNSAGQSPDRYRLIEDFSDFQSTGGLTLPSSYRIFYSYTATGTIQLSAAQNREIQWKFKVTNFSFNQQVDDSAFEIEAD